MRTSSTRNSELWNLCAVCTGWTRHRSDRTGTCQGAVPYCLNEVIDPLGWSKPIDGDEAWSVLTSGYKSIIVVPTAVTLSFSLVRFVVNTEAHSREVDDEDDETELAVERSLM